jgi:signal transduction histidine kinase
MNNYKRTKIKLSLVYFTIIFTIVIGFSLVVYQSQQNQYAGLRNLKEQIENTEPPRNAPAEFRREVSQRLQEKADEIDGTLLKARLDFLLNLVFLDVIILFLAGIFAYLLAERTIQPIQESYQKQKEFIANASHDFKTPLTTMKTQSEIILRSKEVENEEYTEYAQSILEEVNSLSNLTQNLLELAKSEDYDQKLIVQEFNLVELGQKVINKFQHLAEEKKVKLDLISKQKNILFKGDKAKIEELLSLLIDNAINYNKEDGTVVLKLEILKNSQVSIKVIDTGKGISKANLSKVFDRFYRESKDRNASGFGLGLSIAKKIVDDHKGQIELKSVKGKGTEVSVVI